MCFPSFRALYTPFNDRGESACLIVNDILQQRLEPIPMRDGAPLYDRNAITL